ncbi:hypothetical protein N4G70_14730 [Streptomyces sp. ASQP_92]|nr:hypothetical protein [Streptomyces sp. ASQP_92]MCT9090113.1 hypothetical protein [Streptomyces sp. ASQP_92]
MPRGTEAAELHQSGRTRIRDIEANPHPICREVVWAPIRAEPPRN